MIYAVIIIILLAMIIVAAVYAHALIKRIGESKATGGETRIDEYTAEKRDAYFEQCIHQYPNKIAIVTGEANILVFSKRVVSCLVRYQIGKSEFIVGPVLSVDEATRRSPLYEAAKRGEIRLYRMAERPINHYRIAESAHGKGSLIYAELPHEPLAEKREYIEIKDGDWDLEDYRAKFEKEKTMAKEVEFTDEGTAYLSEEGGGSVFYFLDKKGIDRSAYRAIEYFDKEKFEKSLQVKGIPYHYGTSDEGNARGN